MANDRMAKALHAKMQFLPHANEWAWRGDMAKKPSRNSTLLNLVVIEDLTLPARSQSFDQGDCAYR